jgi:hypothetical protein
VFASVFRSTPFATGSLRSREGSRQCKFIMKFPELRKSYEIVGGLVFFGRMLDKIRLHAQGRLPSDYNRGVGFDGRTCRFLHVDYERLVARVLQGGTDAEVLEWCYQEGERPTDEEIFVWNAFMTKRGWRDDVSEWLAEQKRLRGWEHRSDIQTAFDLHAADETEYRAPQQDVNA